MLFAFLLLVLYMCGASVGLDLCVVGYTFNALVDLCVVAGCLF